MLFPDDDPVGKVIINFGQDKERLQIVGVVGNIRHLALDTAPRAELYQPLGQGKWPRMFIAVRNAGGNPLMSSKVKRCLALTEVVGAGDCANVEAVTTRLRPASLSFIVRGDSQLQSRRRNSF